jgi:hypothetical protein
VLDKDRLVRLDETTKKEQGNALSSNITKKSRVNEVDRLGERTGCLSRL